MCSNEPKLKRARAPNIMEDEKAIILHCISQEKHIIESKKTDKFTNKEKNEAWERITANFNINKNIHKRDTKCLRRFWEVEKSKSRQGFSQERQERMATGGGPENKLFNESCPEVHEIIQPRVDPNIVEVQNIYDSDGIALANTLSLTQELNDLEPSTQTLENNYFNFSEDQITVVDKPTTSLKLDGDCVGDLSDRTVNSVPTLISNNNSINDKNDQMFPATHGSLPVKNASLHDGPLQSKLPKRSAKITINEEATLRVKKIQNAIEYEKHLYELQIHHQKLLVEGEIAKRIEENELYKLKKEKLLREIEILKKK